MIRAAILSASAIALAAAAAAQNREPESSSARVTAVNRAALHEPSKAGYLGAVQVYPWPEGVLYRLYAAPERVTDIALQPGETVTSVAAGDTVRWTVGDTTSGNGETRRTHILVKPFSAGLRTNLIVTTDRRVYRSRTLRRLPRRSYRGLWVESSISTTGFRATSPHGGRSGHSTTGGRHSLSSRPALPWGKRRRCSSLARTARRSSSITVSPAATMWSTGCSVRPNCGLGASGSRSCGSPRRSPSGGRDRDDPVIPPAAGHAKADPETLMLRATPRRVTRFRRSAIIAIAAAGSTAIVSAAWLPLKPATLSLVSQSDDKQLGTEAPPDALAGAPASYGRPILNRQRQMEMTASNDPAANAATRAAQEAEAERQRIAAEQKADRESGVMLQISAGPRAAASASANAGADAAPQDAGGNWPSFYPERDPNSQQRKNEMVGHANRDDDINPHALTPPVSPHTLMARSVIAASLITGLNSDLPGLVTAQVTQNVYDSVTGRSLLIPQGSRLIGSYDSVVAFGQSRALVVWQRIILPDGSSIRIDNVPATDTEGHAGLSDQIDRHSWQLLKGVTLSTLLGLGTELSWGSTESDLVRAIRESAPERRARR